ncbi:MAG: radical SAM family heme chaperone HemW [Nitrospirae bacterium]|nr:radical SAM family heme chaperone HemW [Nitrospirota bacterium]MBF0534803.1 radical SAM family heme chaperone HemW [Nitrospirota bacterium]MBF0616477.1 radical SAM family heme chaperone HemW [Nitrospirota bacterium]
METKESFIYVHIPFCLRKCRYCDFYSIPQNVESERLYINALIREIHMRRGEITQIRTLYFGGGTPTVLSNESFSAVIRTFYDNFEIHPDAEITVEANPVTIQGDYDNLLLLRQLGVNRISLGVQSFCDDVLKSLGRLHSAADAREAIRRVSAIYPNFSLDLMYAIPGQSMAVWQDTVKEALSYNPAHISAYELTPEEHTPLWEDIKAGKIQITDEDTTIEMYEFLIKTLKKAGYSHYEISNYALRDRQCQHNLNYWRRGFYTGFGAAAHSHIAADGVIKRYSNAANINSYTEAISNGTLPIVDELIVTESEAERERIFLGLRTTYGVHFENIPKVAVELLNAGLIEINGNIITLTEKGFLVSNFCIGQLTEY